SVILALNSPLLGGTVRRLPLLLTLLASPLAAQTPDYTRAEHLLPWYASPLVYGDSVRPNWMLDNTRFWYRNKGANGGEYFVVDPVRATKTPLFDNARLATAMTAARDTAYDSKKLPLGGLRLTSNEMAIEFVANKKRFV